MIYKNNHGMWKHLKLGAVFMAAIAGIGSFPVPVHAGDAGIKCARISNAEKFSGKIPQLYKNFQKMALLPLTGWDLHERLRVSDDIRVCQTNFGDEPVFTQKRVWLNGKSGASSEFHEYFHAGQYANGSLRTLENPQLTTRDNVMANMLFEATALAYQLMSEQEAKNLGVHLKQPTNGIDYMSDQSAVREHFQETYAAAYEDHQDEGKALEIAGRETSRYLLQWKNEPWRDGYTYHAMEVDNAKPSTVAGGDPAYADLRRDLYLKAGYVSPKINLTPEEFVGPEADKHIEARFNEQFRIENGKVLLAEPKPPGLK